MALAAAAAVITCGGVPEMAHSAADTAGASSPKVSSDDSRSAAAIRLAAVAELAAEAGCRRGTYEFIKTIVRMRYQGTNWSHRLRASVRCGVL